MGSFADTSESAEFGCGAGDGGWTRSSLVTGELFGYPDGSRFVLSAAGTGMEH
jgi:hypothetical protein